MSTISFIVVLIGLTSFMLLVYLPQDVNCARFEALTEPCLTELPATDPNIDMKWVQSVKHWYYPVQSVLDIHRASSEALKVPISELNTADIYYDSCGTFKWYPSKALLVFSIMGGGMNIPMVPNKNASMTFFMDYLKLGGISTVPLTDNKTYLLFYACYNDGTSSWGIGTTTPEVDEKIKKEVFDYAESIGLDKQLFTYIRYDRCKDLPPPSVSTPPQEDNEE